MAAKLKNQASISLPVYCRGIPEKVKIRDHSLNFEGRTPAFDKYLTGIYGIESQQKALVCAADWSRDRLNSPGHNRILMLDAHYLIDNYNQTCKQATPTILSETGWLHMNRISKNFRETLHYIWLEWILSDMSHSAFDNAKDYSLADLAQKYPQYIARMMDKDPQIRGIVHPIYPKTHPDTVLWAATVRLNEPERFGNSTLRYLPEIPVEF